MMTRVVHGREWRTMEAGLTVQLRQSMPGGASDG
jgi:hypothetical protein